MMPAMRALPRLPRPWVLAALGLLLIALAAGYFAGYRVAAGHYSRLFSSFVPMREDGDNYKFVAPLLAYRAPEATELGQYADLKSAIVNETDDATGSGDASRVSTYFRDLNTSAWLGENQNETYYPASLLKVPVMIAYYKEAEDHPSVLSESIAYDPSLAPAEPYDATSTLRAGESYTVEQLIEAMIEQSDNGATFNLLAHVDPQTLADVYENLGIQNPGSDSANYQISTRTYALFFRVLYNATYLSPDYSEKALELLSRATFDDGLAAGLPSATVVAHKYGEHVLTSGNAVTGVELHDCGVVYYPGHPYLLCVMTSAKDLATATSIIKDISATTYAAVAKRYGK